MLPPSHRLPAPGESVTVPLHRRGARNGVLAHASGDTITLFLPPPRRVEQADGTFALVEDDPRDSLGTLGHELAHIAMGRAGLDPPTWLSEGAADLVGGLAPGPAGLCDVGPPRAALERALALDPAEWRLAPLLAWREDGARVESGAEAVDLPRRALCGLYVRWLLDLSGDGRPVADLAARLRELAWREALLAGADRPGG